MQPSLPSITGCFARKRMQQAKYVLLFGGQIVLICLVQTLPPDFVDRVQAAYLDAFYAFLDGLVHVAFSDPPEKISESTRLATVTPKATPFADVENLVSLSAPSNFAKV